MNPILKAYTSFLLVIILMSLIIDYANEVTLCNAILRAVHSALGYSLFCLFFFVIGYIAYSVWNAFKK